jgi:hypothetical protein
LVSTTHQNKVEVSNYSSSKQIDLIIDNEQPAGHTLYTLPLNAESLMKNFLTISQNFSHHLYFSIHQIDFILTPVNALSESNGVISVMYITDPLVEPYDASDEIPSIWAESPDVSILMVRQDHKISWSNFSNPVINSSWRFIHTNSQSDPRQSAFGTIIIGNASKTNSLTAGKYHFTINISYSVKERVILPTTVMEHTATTSICSKEIFNAATASIDIGTDARLITVTLPTHKKMVGTLILQPGRDFVVTFTATDNNAEPPIEITEDQPIPIHRMEYVDDGTNLYLTFPLPSKHLSYIDYPDKVTVRMFGPNDLTGFIRYSNVTQKYIPSSNPQQLSYSIKALGYSNLPRCHKNKVKTKLVSELLSSKS